jgi:tripartite ATP-independent transporter DctM subunit
MAGVLPGLLLALLFMGYVVGWSILRPSEVPVIADKMTFFEKLKESRFLIPIVVLILAVIGSMYGGWATATEAAAIGVIGSLLLAAVQGSLGWSTFVDSLLGATRTSAMIALILMGATALTLAMGFTGLPRALAEFIDGLGLSTFSLLMALMLFYIVLGMFLDGISSVVLTMAIVQPMIESAGIDLIWFGIFIVIVVEMAQITPPIGFNLFVMQGITKHEMGYIAKTALPLFAIMVGMVFIMITWPELATYLPSTMRDAASAR